MMGGDILVDVHVMVDEKISVSEGHFISEQVDRALHEAFATVKDVTVHIDHEDDEFHTISANLPNRNTLLAKINSSTSSCTASDAIVDVVLHYSKGELIVDLIFLQEKITEPRTWQAIKTEYKSIILAFPEVKDVRVLLAL